MKLIKMYLHLHEDGAASAAEGATAETAEPTIVYGVGEEQPSTEQTTEPATETETPPEKKSFEDLIKTEYKEDFEKKTQAIVNERFKATKSIQESLEKTAPVMKVLAIRYGIKEGDWDALSKAIENDPNLLIEQAQKEGVSVDQLKKMKDYDNLQAQIQTQKQMFRQKAETDATIQKWEEDSETLKLTYPDFELKEAMKNVDFSRALKAGLPIKAAYAAGFSEKLIKEAVKQTSAMTASNIAQKQARHTEAGVSNQAGVIHKTDVSSFTEKDMEDTRRRAMNGEIIHLSKR